ncbi:MAG TPA: hypothetical protein VN632_10180 [Stellaceae bacterium]|nr:hypothetical protein [Stellaceae bacterium]
MGQEYTKRAEEQAWPSIPNAQGALDLAGAGSAHRIDIAARQERLGDNLERTD